VNNMHDGKGGRTAPPILNLVTRWSMAVYIAPRQLTSGTSWIGRWGLKKVQKGETPQPRCP
jgi:hypothetical protein